MGSISASRTAIAISDPEYLIAIRIGNLSRETSPTLLSFRRVFCSPCRRVCLAFHQY